MNYFDLLIKEDKLALNLDNKSYTYKNLFVRFKVFFITVKYRFSLIFTI